MKKQTLYNIETIKFNQLHLQRSVNLFKLLLAKTNFYCNAALTCLFLTELKLLKCFESSGSVLFIVKLGDVVQLSIGG